MTTEEHLNADTRRLLYHEAAVGTRRLLWWIVRRIEGDDLILDTGVFALQAAIREANRLYLPLVPTPPITIYTDPSTTDILLPAISSWTVAPVILSHLEPGCIEALDGYFSRDPDRPAFSTLPATCGRRVRLARLGLLEQPARIVAACCRNGLISPEEAREERKNNDNVHR